jgi:IS1 family transposase
VTFIEELLMADRPLEASEHVRNVKSRRIQCDEIWQFCYAKAKNVPADKKGTFGYGGVWTWTALDADTKLIPSWLVSTRDGGAAYTFMTDVASRLANRAQLTTDGHRAYLDTVDDAFGADIDYAVLQKLYGSNPDRTRHSPSKIIGLCSEVIRGNPNLMHVSTSFVERQNLSMRMGMRRFTRLTNGLSKKVENHAHAVALYFVHYNFARIQQTLRITPAIAAGISDHVWIMEEHIGLLGRISAVAA